MHYQKKAGRFVSMQLPVTYYSQYDQEIPEEWKKRSCGIVALRMALSLRKEASVQSSWGLVQEGLSGGAYKDGVGWKHDGLVQLAKKHGAHAFRREFRSWFLKTFYFFAEQHLRMSLQRGIVPIVSLTVPDKNDTHLVPLIGYDNTGFIYHEPAAHTPEEGRAKHISFADFKKRWRKLAIFVGFQ